MRKIVRNIIARLMGISTEGIKIDYSSKESVIDGFKKAGYNCEPVFVKLNKKEELAKV